MNQSTKAVIFDMNGVIINDERIHQESWRQICKKYGLSLTEEEFKSNIFGRTEADTFAYIFHRSFSPEELASHSAERVKIVIDIFKPRLAMADGLLSFLQELKNNNIPVGIATGSRINYTNFILDGLDIRQYFQQIVTAEEVSHGKPEPEIYLLAAQKLEVNPQDCIVFEDSISGIKSGHSAGMKVVAITSTHQTNELQIADKIIASFSEISVSSLESI